LIFGSWLITSFAEKSPISYDAESYNTKNYHYIITFDKNMSSVSSSDLAISGIEAYRQLDNYCFGKTTNVYENALSYFTRFMVTNYIRLANHEIGGHGARVREFGLSASYKISPIKGHTSFSGNSSKFMDFPVQKRVAFDVAGMQASHLLAENLKVRYLELNNINPTYGIGYFLSQADQPMYIFFSKDKGEKDDVANYIKNINKLYNTNYYTKKKLKRYAFLDLFDPFMWFSAYSYIMNQDTEVSMFKINQDVKYLPATRAVLAPYGLEVKLINHFIFNGQKQIQVSISYGKNMNRRSYSIGANGYNLLIINNIGLGAELILWSQPQILTSNIITAKTKKGGLFAVNTKFDLLKTTENIIGGIVSIGFKSSGFIEGRPLGSSLLLRAGLQISV
jgi:hypothetical protein